MIYIPNQYFGIGDIIWSQTLIRRIASGSPIIWPVEKHYVDGLRAAYPDIDFRYYKDFDIDYNRKEEHEVVTSPMHFRAKVIPIRWADIMLNAPYNMCMRSKYDLYKMKWEDWQDNAMWMRNPEREKEFFDRFGITGEYNLVNNLAGTESQLKGRIRVDNGLPTIEMRTIEDYSLFDWAYIIENATHIHTVSTSIIYLLEQLELKCKAVDYYLKPNEKDFSSTEYILRRHKYNYHR